MDEQEQRYNNRQLERFFDEPSRDLKEYFDTGFKPILAQTTKTNGRVTSLEETVGKMDRRIDRIQTLFWVAGIVFSATWALFLAIVSSGALKNLHL